MTYETICKLENIFDKLVLFNYGVGMFLGLIFFGPIYLLIKYIAWLSKMSKVCWYKYYHHDEYMSKVHLEKSRSQYENRELPISKLKHSFEVSFHNHHDENAVFFFSKREYIIPRFSLVYVENKYNESMHHFFDKRADLIKKWEIKHGWEILFVDKESIKEGMFFPQDYDEHFHHGFLYNHFASSSDPEYYLRGDLHSYYEIDPTSDEDILKQLNDLMPRIYKSFDWQVV